MKHPTRLTLTLSALTALLCACQAEQQEKQAPAPANGSSSAAAAEAPAPRAEAAPAKSPAATAAPAAPTAEAPAAAPTAPTATAEKPAAEEPAKAPEVAVTEGFAVGQKMPSYKNTIRRAADPAKEEAFDTQAQTKPTVYIANSTTCPYCTVYIDRLKALEARYMAKGVDVVHVYPVPDQTAESKVAHYTAKGYQGGLITDQKAEFAKALDIHKTPTAILTDANGKIVYRGRIDDNAKAEKVHVNELADAIDATLAGKPVQVATTEPFG
jgi:peroxiredoxin